MDEGDPSPLRRGADRARLGVDEEAAFGLAGVEAGCAEGAAERRPVVGPDQQDGLAARDAAKKKLEEMRSQYAQDIITSEMQPMQPGDLVLAEIVPGTFEIQEVTASGRASYMNVPHSGYSEIFAFAEGNSGGRNLWLTKLSDPGPAVLMKKAGA